MSKIQCDLGQLSSLTANISGTDRDIDKMLNGVIKQVLLRVKQKNW